MLEISEFDKIYFADKEFLSKNVLNPNINYKICVRFDGALEMVENFKDYCIRDPRFNWCLEQKFNFFSPNEYKELHEYNNYDNNDHFRDQISFFFGNLDGLRKALPSHCRYEFIECDYMDGIWKPPIKSTEILELITDTRSNVRIGYCIRRINGNAQICIQSFHPIDVHYHSDEGWYDQAVLFDRQNKNRLVFMGAQNDAVGCLAIPELYFEENYDRVNDRNVDFHEKYYVKEFMKHNLIYCDEAKNFYIPENSMYACKICMKMAQNLLKQM